MNALRELARDARIAEKVELRRKRAFLASCAVSLSCGRARKRLNTTVERREEGR